MKAELSLPRRPTALYLVGVLDVVVLLLVFFLMVAGAGQEAGVLVSMPESEFRVQRYERPIVVTVKGGVDPAIFVGRERVSRRSFASHVQKLVEENGSETVLLRADANLSVGMEREIIESAARLGLRVVLVGQEAGGPGESLPAPAKAEPKPDPVD